MKRDNLRPKRVKRNRPRYAGNARRFCQTAKRNNLKNSIKKRRQKRNLQKTFVKAQHTAGKCVNRPQNYNNDGNQIKNSNYRLMHRAVSQRRKNKRRAQQKKQQFTCPSCFDFFYHYLVESQESRVRRISLDSRLFEPFQLKIVIPKRADNRTAVSAISAGCANYDGFSVGGRGKFDF